MKRVGTWLIAAALSEKGQEVGLAALWIGMVFLLFVGVARSA